MRNLLNDISWTTDLNSISFHRIVSHDVLYQNFTNGSAPTISHIQVSDPGPKGPLVYIYSWRKYAQGCKRLVARIALCSKTHVKECKDLMSQLFCWLIFVKCTILIRNYNAYLILALFGIDGHCITIANVSLQFKKYSFCINTIFNHSQRSHISQCSISTITIHTNIIIIQVKAISFNIILFFLSFSTALLINA